MPTALPVSVAAVMPAVLVWLMSPPAMRSTVWPVATRLPLRVRAPVPDFSVMPVPALSPAFTVSAPVVVCPGIAASAADRVRLPSATVTGAFTVRLLPACSVRLFA